MHDSPTLHVLDIENLVGGPVPNPEAVKAIHGEYMRLMAPTGPDRSVMGTSHIAAKHIWFSWPDRSTKRLVRSGADGADLALLGYLSEPANLRGVHHVVIASGDAIFTPAVRRLRMNGIRVTVVSRPQSLAGSLRAEADEVKRLVVAA